MKKLILTLCCFASTFFVNAQLPKLGWAKMIGGTNSDQMNSMAIDGSGNVYSTGFFQGTSDHDPGTGTVNLSSLGLSDIFISKLDATGNLKWAFSLGSTGSDGGLAITTDTHGDVYVTGYFEYTIDFDPGAGITKLTAKNTIAGTSIFVAKYDTDGRLVWAKSIGADFGASGTGIKVDAGGDIYVIGSFIGDAVDFDPGANTKTLNDNDGELFILKLDQNGNFKWVKNMVENGKYKNISLDASGNIYLCGYFEKTADFDPDGSAFFKIPSQGLADIFILKLDPNGNFIWAKAIGGTGYEISESMVLDGSANIHVTGWFSSPVDFDPDASASNNLTSAGTNDIFILKLDANGKFKWAGNMGGDSADRGQSIALDVAGNVYITGTFERTADFDPGSGSSNITSSGKSDLFISKLNASGNFEWAQKIGGTSWDMGSCMAFSSSGILHIGGHFTGTIDCDPDAPVLELKGPGLSDIMILKFGAGSGLRQMEMGNSINIYPNPTTGILHFESGIGRDNRIKIEIFNFHGQLLIEEISNSENSSLNIEHLPTGLYFVRVKNGTGSIATGRIAKE